MRPKTPPSRRSKSSVSGSERRGPGRPTSDPKTVRMELRLSEGDVTMLDTLVRARASDRSGVVRALIRAAYRPARGRRQ
jgi:hypothetical protein